MIGEDHLQNREIGIVGQVYIIVVQYSLMFHFQRIFNKIKNFLSER